MWSCNIAPSQLHPNSWGFIKIFQLLCRELNVTPSQTLFLYLFVSAKPGGSSKKKASWVSFRSAQGHKVFAMYDESFKDFKNYFFKVRAVEGARPFFLDENDEPSFPLEWQRDVRVSRYTWEMLDDVERAFVVVLEDLRGKPPHLDTKRILNDPSLVRTAWVLVGLVSYTCFLIFSSSYCDCNSFLWLILYLQRCQKTMTP